MVIIFYWSLTICYLLSQFKEEIRKLQAENADLKKQLTQAQGELSIKMKEAEDDKVTAVSRSKCLCATSHVQLIYCWVHLFTFD